MRDIENRKPDLYNDLIDKVRISLVLLNQVYHFDCLDLGNRPPDRILNTRFESHVRHSTVATVTNELKLQDIVFRDLEYLHVTTISLEIRPDVVE